VPGQVDGGRERGRDGWTKANGGVYISLDEKDDKISR
jgi:hypothetical protein